MFHSSYTFFTLQAILGRWGVLRGLAIVTPPGEVKIPHDFLGDDGILCRIFPRILSVDNVAQIVTLHNSMALEHELHGAKFIRGEFFI
jgi:hypothetical protein